MPFITDQNGFTYYVDDSTGQIITPNTGTVVTEPGATGPIQGVQPGDTVTIPGTGTFKATQPDQTVESIKQTTPLTTPAETAHKAAEVAEKELKPFIADDGTVDVAKALDAGGAIHLRNLGVSDAAIERAREVKQAAKDLDAFKTKAGGYDLVGAIRAGKIREVRAAGFKDTDIIDAQAAAAQQPITRAAMDKLTPYTNDKGEVAGYEYLRFHPNDAATLRAVGFDNKTIGEWEAWADNPAVRANPIDRYHEMVKAAGGTPLPPTLETLFGKQSDGRVSELANTLGYGYQGREIAAYRKLLDSNPALAKARAEMLAEVSKSGKAKPDVSLEGFTAEYVAARTDTTANRDAAALEYKRLYGTKTTVGSTAVRFTKDYIFAPARALYPEVDVKDISLREWGVGVVQVGFLAAPGLSSLGAAGKYAMAGVEGTAAGLMTAGIAKDWNTMSSSERALSIGIDTLVLASAINRIVPLRDVAAKVLKPTGGTLVDKRVPPVKPTATESTLNRALVKLGGKRPDVNAALHDIRVGVEKGDRALLTAGAQRLRLVSRQIPKQLGGRALDDYAKNLLKNPDDVLRLGKGQGLKAADIERVNEGLRANKQHLDMINRQLEKTKSANLRRALQTEREKVKQIVKVQERTKLDIPRTKVIMPDEAGKAGPIVKRTTALVLRRKAALKPKGTQTTTALVLAQRQRVAGGPPTRTRTGTGTPWPETSGRRGRMGDFEAPGYLPLRRDRPDVRDVPVDATITVTSTRLSDVLKQQPVPFTRPKPGESTSPAEGTQTKPETAPATGTQPETRTQPDTGTKTGTQPEPDTETRTGTQPKEGTRTPTPIKTGTGTRPPRRPRLDKMTDEQKRHMIAGPGNAAFTWQQGKLRGEPVHHVGVVTKDGEVIQTTVVGAAPDGAIKASGKGQSYKSITMTTKGRLQQPVRLEGGAIDPVVSPEAGGRKVSIRFVQDDKVRERKPKERPLFSIRRRAGTGARGRDLGADIVSDRRGRHLRL